jgi:hypothetical protein
LEGPGIDELSTAEYFLAESFAEGVQICLELCDLLSVNISKDFLSVAFLQEVAIFTCEVNVAGAL